MKNQLKLALWVVATAFAVQAHASPSWTLNTTSVSDSGVTASSSGWANTQGDTATLIEVQDSLNLYGGGLGIYNNDQPTSDQHTVDNNGRYEAVLVSFSEKVKLESVGLGWITTDSDLTVFRYTGSLTSADAVKTTMTGTSYLGLTTNGWEVVGNYAGNSSTYSRNVNAVGNYSSFWLIGAYNPLVGGSNILQSGSTLSDANDYIKLQTVAGTTCSSTNSCGSSNKVSEPGTVGLLGFAFLGLLGLRKAKKV